MNRKRCCHYCGQELPEHRLGIRMRPVEGRIFDYVVTAGSAGISNGDLYELALGEKGRSRHTLNVHICNINEKLADTGYQIVGRDVRLLAKAKRYHEGDALSPEQQKAFGL